MLYENVIAQMLNGKIVIVTGANFGMGMATTAALAGAQKIWNWQEAFLNSVSSWWAVRKGYIYEIPK